MGRPSTLGDPGAARQRLLELRIRQKQARSGAAWIPRRPDSGSAPASYAQKALWILDQLWPDKCVYNTPSLWRLMGTLDVEALRRSIQALFERHETLRTRFELSADDPVQVIQPPFDVASPVTDLSSMPQGERGLHARQLIEAATHEPFDLERGPLWRAQLLRLASAEHWLLLDVHHIASDGWSRGVLWRELSIAYHAFSIGRAPELPALPIQYADYAVWQRERLQGGALDGQLAYWKEQLADLPTLELPTDRPRPAVLSYQGARVDVELAVALTQGLKELGQREGATLFMTFLAAFQVLLYRYSGQGDIAVGTPIAGRGRFELEGLIGFFANTLVLRTRLDGSPSFRGLLARVRESALGAYAHQDLPFEKLVEELAPVRDLSRNPLFQVCFAVQNLTEGGLRLQGLAVEPVALPTEQAKFDLTLTCQERDGQWQASFEYSTDLFEPQSIERMAGHFQVLLGALLSNPDQGIDTLALMSEAERHRLLVQWNDTSTDLPRQTLAEAFEAQVRRTPEAVAVLDATQCLSYAELNARANQLAHYLRARGVGPDVPVAICMERSPALLVGLLAILKAGAAYVPLDPRYGGERHDFMLADAEVSVVLTHTPTRERFAQSSTRVLCVDENRVPISLSPDDNGHARLNPESVAYIIYTSGSTGKPKGVQIPQRGIANHLCWIGKQLELSAADRLLHFTSIGFDASVWELLAPLQVGASLYLAQPGGERDMVYLARTVCEQHVTVLQVVPSMLRALLEQLQHCRSLRHLVCGGEPLDFELVERVREQAPWVVLGNFYGPTETSIDATHQNIDAKLRGTGLVPIGRPIANTRCYVLDPRLEPVPVGVLGELYIGGAGLALGYLNRPDWTAERFVGDPFRPGERLYRSGDLVRYRSDGSLVFVGRNDEQVKIRGYRIELGEIEASLNRCEGVQHSAVLAREDPPGQKRLVAYLAGRSLSRAALFEQLKQRLPEYMVPTALVLLDALPILPNGKVNRRALQAAQYSRADLGGTPVDPRSPLEELIAEVWREALGLKQVGVHDNFFELGGHSLLAGRVVARLARLCAVEVPLRRIFEGPTIAALAEEIEQLRGSLPTVESAVIAAVTRIGFVPLSFAQQRLWYLDQLSQHKAPYKLRVIQRLRGVLDPQTLRWAFDALVVRHESLRIRVTTTAGEAGQVIDVAGPASFATRDLSSSTTSDAEARARELVQAEVDRPFDLALGPLVRVLLLRLEEQVHVLAVTLHHVVSDGWSVGVLERELSAVYNARVAGRAPELPALPIQYADYAVWQRERLQGGALDGQLAYWKEQLADLPTLELPTDRPRPAVLSYQGARVDVELAVALTQGLKELGQREGATLFMTFLAAFQVLLYRYSGQGDIAVGTPIAGRGRFELEGLIGFFANTLVLRTRLDGSPSFRGLLARVRESALGAYAHQDLPFEKLVEELAPVRDLSRNPLFQVCFAVQNLTEGGLRLQGLAVEPVALPTEQAKFDLTLTCQERDGQWQASFEYSTDLFEPQSIERMAGHFQVLLGALLSNPDQGIDTLALMSEAERHRLLVQWNDTSTDLPRQTLAEAFEAQVRRTPEAVAVLDATQCLSYAELNARANQLAHYLRARGVGPDVPVAICMERSPALLVGLLAILKAGAAYVPLDADQPRERLAFQLQDSAAGLLLMQQTLLDRLPVTGCPRVCLDRDWAEIEKHPTDDPTGVGSPQQLAYIIYTSGSTGAPKGVAIRQQGVLRLVVRTNYVSIRADDVVAQVSNVAFDAATFEIWGALLNGARLVILPRDVVLSPRQLARALGTHQVTCMFLTTAVFNEVSAEIPTAFKSLRYLLIGGEALNPDRVRAVMQAGAPEHLINAYGPTETTTFATFHVVREDQDRVRVPIGRPISGTEVLLLDAYGTLVPPGVIGEIHIGGLGVAVGYIGRPEETQARFIQHPFYDARLFRTGDLARQRPDGAIEFLGRNDDQVKIRGFRVEPAEITAALSSHPRIRACHVMPRRQPTGEKGLTAYVVLEGHGDMGLSPVDLRRFLSERLPTYMIPATFVVCESLPLTVNGKVDSRALPEPVAGHIPESGGYVAPRDAIEQSMCRVWSVVLGIERVGLDANFFEIGGHSLLAAKLFARMDEEFGRSPALGVLYTAPTVRLLAAHYRDPASSVDASAHALVALQSGGTLPPLYLVPGVFGNVVGYADFVRELGPDQPIYGLQSIGLDGRAAPYDSIEAMARHYVAEVRGHQRRGPYAIIGACFGATIAYEMARQLMASGETIAFLGLVAPTTREGDELGEHLVHAPRFVRRVVALGELARQRLHGYLREMRGLGLSGQLMYVSRKLRSLMASVLRTHGLKGTARELNQLEVYRANLHALDRYLRRPLEGRIAAIEIFEPSDIGSPGRRCPSDWEAGCPVPPQWHLLPGKDSGQMLTGENARVIAALLSERLELVRRERRHSRE